MTNFRRPSLKDIAQRLNVSIATVSRALRGSPEIGPEMTSKVKALAEEMNYHPNPFARSLRERASRVIGVVVPNIATHYYATVLEGIEDAATKAGYSVISANSHENHELEKKVIDNFLTMHVEGIIACLAQDSQDYTHFQKIHELGVPLVFFARTCLPELFSSVTADGDVAAQKATQHLIDTGSRRIAFIGGPNHLDMVRRRKHGYLEALRESHIPIDRELVACNKIDYDVAREKVVEMIRSDHRPDAVIAFNDIITYACFDAIKSEGLLIPDDVALIGFTDAEYSRFTTPRLSVIKDQAHKTGERACELLMGHLNGDTKLHHEVVPMILEIRESSSKHTGD